MRHVKIAAIQFDMRLVSGFSAFERRVRDALAQTDDCSIVVFPEWVTAPLVQCGRDADARKLSAASDYTDEYLSLFQSLARERRQLIVAGSHPTKVGARLYNMCHVVGPDGTHYQHAKTHVVGLERTWATTEGDSIGILETDDVKLGVAICYEIEFPEVIRILALKGAEVIVCPSFCPTEDAYWRVRHCCEARCVENQLFVVNSTPVGEFASGWLTLYGNGRASILGPCQPPWPSNGLIAEGKPGTPMAVVADLDLDSIRESRESGFATPFRDRARRSDLYGWIRTRDHRG